MRSGIASGTHIAFFIFAVTLLAVPLSSYVENAFGITEARRELIGRGIPFVLGALLIVIIPALRRVARLELSTHLPGAKMGEVVAVAIAALPAALAASAAAALWIWLSQGNEVLANRMGNNVDLELEYAFSPDGLMLYFLVATIAAPLVEELVFRGFLYRAWERRWGWVPSMLLVSILFGLYHTHFLSAFMTSVVFVCVLRRTGSLWAPILVHAFGNAMLWYPLLGQLVIPDSGRAIGDISSWSLQLACLLYAALALPAYVWMARKEYRRDLFTAT